MVKDDFWTDTELMDSLPPAGRMLYQGLWQLAESSGVIEHDIIAFKIQLFPLDEGITKDKLKEWTEILIELGKLTPYKAKGKDLLYIKNFHKHQSLRNPGKPENPLPKFIRYLPNSEKHKSGWYLIDYGLMDNGQLEGKVLVGSANDDFKKQWGDVNVSLTNDQGNEREVEREVEREGEREGEGEVEREVEGEVENNSPSSAEEKYNDSAPTKNGGLDYGAIKTLWNERVPEKLQIRAMTDKRKKKLRVRCKEEDFDLDEIIDALQEQPFCLGDNERGWVADFTWLIKNSENYLKVLEHRYSNNKESEQERLNKITQKIDGEN